MQAFLRICAQIEDTLGEIYRLMAKTVPCDPRLREVWLQMAKEEDEHACKIRFAARLPAQDVFRERKMETRDVANLLQKSRNLITRLQRSPIAEAEALSLSLKLEQHFQHVHITAAAEFLEPQMQKMLMALGRADAEHLARLTNYQKERLAEQEEVSQSQL